jgi:hypothetical protein
MGCVERATKVGVLCAGMVYFAVTFSALILSSFFEKIITMFIAFSVVLEGGSTGVSDVLRVRWRRTAAPFSSRSA